MPNLFKFIILLACLGLIATGGAGMADQAQEPGWSNWDQEHAVAREEDWLVIKDPAQGLCYIKQGYLGQRMMDLELDEHGALCLWGPFSPVAVDVQVQYQIDHRGQERFIARQVSNGLRLPDDLIQEMQKGYVLTVKVESLDPEQELGTVPEQEFSLLGFLAATKVLDTQKCP